MPYYNHHQEVSLAGVEGSSALVVGTLEAVVDSQDKLLQEMVAV